MLKGRGTHSQEGGLRRSDGGSGGGDGGRGGGRRIEDLPVKGASALALADGDRRRLTER